jgi:hypothetical protein
MRVKASVYRALFALFFFAKPFISYGASLERYGWNIFEGKLEGRQMQLAVYLVDTQRVEGNYAFEGSPVKHHVTGFTRGDSLFLHGTEPEISFVGHLFTDTLDELTGTWEENGQPDNLMQFSLRSTAITRGSLENQYEDMYGTEAEVESFALKVKNAVIQGDKTWLADHIQYPLRCYLSGKLKAIKNREDFLKAYDSIITTEFKEKLNHVYTTNLFTKDGEVMLGNGEIWIGNTTHSSEEKYDFIITTINL